MLNKFRIEYITPKAGLFIFARIAEEDGVKALRERGVLVAEGKAFHVTASEVGWVRINLAVTRETLVEGLAVVEAYREEKSGRLKGVED